MSNYPDNFSGHNMDASDDSLGVFEPIALRECDDCGRLDKVNEIGYCAHCDAAAEIFNKAAAAAMKRGHDPFTAGMIAQKEVERLSTADIILPLPNKAADGPRVSALIREGALS